MVGGLAAPPFSGGIWDAWPAWAVDALAICQEEVREFRAFETAEKPRR